MKSINYNRLETICGKELSIQQKHALFEWAKEFEATVKSELELQYKHNYDENLSRGINYFIIAIAFVLHFGEETKYDNKKLKSILNDIQATVDMFETGEYSAEEYLKMLKDDGMELRIKCK